MPFDRDFSSFPDFRLNIVNAFLAKLFILRKYPFDEVSFFIASGAFFHFHLVFALFFIWYFRGVTNPGCKMSR